MFQFETHEVQRNAVAALAALVMSASCILFAVGPARAIETAPVYAAAAPASGQANV